MSNSILLEFRNYYSFSFGRLCLGVKVLGSVFESVIFLSDWLSARVVSSSISGKGGVVIVGGVEGWNANHEILLVTQNYFGSQRLKQEKEQELLNKIRKKLHQAINQGEYQEAELKLALKLKTYEELYNFPYGHLFSEELAEWKKIYQNPEQDKKGRNLLDEQYRLHYDFCGDLGIKKIEQQAFTSYQPKFQLFRAQVSDVKLTVVDSAGAFRQLGQMLLDAKMVLTIGPTEMTDLNKAFFSKMEEHEEVLFPNNPTFTK
ncbi:11078_t:CDS:2 [Ambispora leptoticha]|uniref:11078_t:CDS:1 n=1 Tax=Ambispora leptoticha TaxID=144679 RepID=A0A9N9CDA4_9GLOM|nr:11078_t:CDS:2 [Ambispora leptoticha]